MCVSKILPSFRVKTPQLIWQTWWDSKELDRAEKFTLFTTAVYWEDTLRNTNTHTHTRTEKSTPPTSSITPPQAHTHPGWVMQTPTETDLLSRELAKISSWQTVLWCFSWSRCNSNKLSERTSHLFFLISVRGDLSCWIYCFIWTLAMGWKEEAQLGFQPAAVWEGNLVKNGEHTNNLTYTSITPRSVGWLFNRITHKQMKEKSFYILYFKINENNENSLILN